VGTCWCQPAAACVPAAIGVPDAVGVRFLLFR
jgi:hypothetical protein